ncbi:membrane protein [Synergistales bacterium]|nr:membrane protein [Synergistales bacterium]
MPTDLIDTRALALRFSLKNILTFLAVVCAILTFCMAIDVIDRGYIYAFPVFLAASVFLEQSHLSHPPRILINLASVATLLIIFSHVRRNYIVEALMEAVLLMTAIKMFEKKEPRDYAQISALSLAAVVAYAMISVEKTFILYCFGTTLLCTLSLMLSAWFLREPDARLTLEELRGISMRAASLFLLMLPLSILFFFIMPRTDRPIFGMARTQYGSGATGFSDRVTLGDAAAIQNNDRLAFRAVMEPLPEYIRPYWRGLALDFFEGRMWVAGQGRRDGLFVPEPESVAPRVEQEIFLEQGNRGVLFTLDKPVLIYGINAFALGGGAFRSEPRSAGRRLQYNVVSSLSPVMRPADPTFDKRRNLSLPQNFIPRLAPLVTDMTRGMNGREKSEAIRAYLSSPRFSYSLEELPTDPRNALEQFIFTTGRGNCEYFASAMGVMLRMAGVPSRLVNGYVGGVYNDVGGYYIVQENMAHVWVEAWDETLEAWVRYDPTPVGLLGAANNFDKLEFYLDMMDYQWSKLIVNYNWEVQSEVLSGIREMIRNPRASLTPTGAGMRRLSSALSVPAMATAGVALCLCGVHLLRKFRLRRPELELLRRFLREMKRRGYDRGEHEGLEEFLSRVDDTPLRALALPFVRRFEDFYYGGVTIDASDLKLLQITVAKITGYKYNVNNLRKAWNTAISA